MHPLVAARLSPRVRGRRRDRPRMLVASDWVAPSCWSHCCPRSCCYWRRLAWPRRARRGPRPGSRSAPDPLTEGGRW